VFAGNHRVFGIVKSDLAFDRVAPDADDGLIKRSFGQLTTVLFFG
jgi:hypothetical protein